MTRTLLTAFAASLITCAVLAATSEPHLIAGKPKGTPAQKVQIAKRNLAHAKGSCVAYRKAGRSLASTGSHCRAVPWLRAVAIRVAPLGFREYVYLRHPCLAPIIAIETGHTWDPTIDYGFGHGNVYEAYGIPGANPGTKMKSAGPDWRTNPYTQLRWMIGYTNGRYGSECEALAFHRRNGWY